MSVITTTIRLEDSQFFATLNRIEGRMSTLAGSFAAVATRMASAFAPVAIGVGGVTGAVLGLKKAVDEAGNMEQLLTSFTVLIGSATVATETLGKLQKFADETTFQMPEVAGAAKQLLAFGVGAEEVVSSLRMLGDVATGLNIPLSELTDVYGRNLVQGRLFSRDIYQFQSRGIPIVAALAKQFGVAESELMGLVEAGQVGSKQMVAAFQDMTKEGGLFSGMLAKQSRTFNGLMSTLADNISAVFREFGKPLNESLKPIVAELIQRVREMAPAAQEFGDRVGRVISGLYAAFKAGTLSEVVSLALELGFMKAMNALAGGLETALAAAGAGFSELFGDQNFWGGLLKTLLGIAGQFGAAMLRAVDKPLAYVQAAAEQTFDMDNLGARVRAFTKTADAHVQADGAANPFSDTFQADYARNLKAEGFISIEERANRILSEGGPRFGFGGAGMNAAEIAKEGAALVTEGAEQLKQPTSNFHEAVKLLIAKFEPAALYDPAKMEAVENRLRALFPDAAGVTGANDAGNARGGKGPGDIIGGGSFSVIADSLARIGGGGGVAGVGVSEALNEAREQTSELKTQTAELREIKQGIIQIGRLNSSGRLEITTSLT